MQKLTTPLCAWQVWDGRFSGAASVTVLVREAVESGLLFTYPVYSASIRENAPDVTLVTVVNTVGHRLNEPLRYTLLNAGGRFTIRPTCGVVHTTGVPFDREEKDSYELVVEVSREDEILRVARVTVQIQVRVEIPNTSDRPKSHTTVSMLDLHLLTHMSQ